MQNIPTSLSVQSIPSQRGGRQCRRLVKDGGRSLVRAQILSSPLPWVSILKSACASEFGWRRQHRKIRCIREPHLRNKESSRCPTFVSFTTKPICHVQNIPSRLRHCRPKLPTSKIFSIVSVLHRVSVKSITLTLHSSQSSGCLATRWRNACR